MKQFGVDSIIVKYKNENYLTKILQNGEELPLELKYYDNDLKKRTFVLEGVSFTLTDKKRYIYPKEKDDLKNGMIVEYFNNNIWTKREISDIENEYERMFKLLMKYEKLRYEYVWEI